MILAMLRRLLIAVLTLMALPLLFLLAASLIGFNLLFRITLFTRRPAPLEPVVASSLCSIIILNWNGKDLLARGLPSVLEAVRVTGLPHEVIVVDNGSEDGSVAFVEQNFPGVRVVALPENLGFAAGNNRGVREASHDIVVLLNNDMVVDPGFLQPLLDGFEPDTFAVTSQIFHQDTGARREETGKTTATFRRGMIDFAHEPLDDRSLSRPYYPVLWAGGGSSAFHRKRFLELGGFPELYSPAYVEDTDLSYRAWKSGYAVLFCPRSVVHHKHRASSKKRFQPKQLEQLILRNQFLFLWKNLRCWPLLLSHCLFLPWNCYRLARDHGFSAWKAFVQAVLRLPELEITRFAAPIRSARSDSDIFRQFARPGTWYAGRRSAGGERADTGAGRPRVLWMTAYLPHLGRHAGAGRMFHLLKRLSVQYRITLLSFLEHDEEREFLAEVEPLCERVVAIRRRAPMRWQLYAYEPFDEFLTPEMQRALDIELEERDYDLINLEYTQMAAYADRETGIPSLLTKHEVDFAACLRRARLERSAWMRFRWFYNYLQVLDREIRLLRRVDAAVCMTEPDARELGRFCSTVPIHVVNTGVDLDYFRPPSERIDAPRMVFVGAFQHQPNVDAMTWFCREILPLIRREVPNAEIVIVGSNPPPPILNLADEPGVQVTGFVPDVRPYMASSAVYVVPLRLGVGIRGKILEAWAMGMPVVATSVACAGLRYEHGVHLLRADDAGSFAGHVLGLLRDEALRSKLGGEGRRTAEDLYGWDSAAQKVDELYEKYIGLYQNRAR